MNAEEMKSRLRRHFVQTEWDEFGEYGQLFMTEVVAPNRERRIDVLHVNMRANRGYGIDAVEIKTSLTDFKSEIRDQNKAEAWWPYCNRFWIAVPSLDVAPPEMIPPGWGLMIPPTSERRRKFQVIVEPSERQPIIDAEFMAILMNRVRSVGMESWNEMQREHQSKLSAAIRKIRDEHREEDRDASIPIDIVRKIEQLNKLEDLLGFELSGWDDFMSSKVTPQTLSRSLKRVILDEGEVSRKAKASATAARNARHNLENLIGHLQHIEDHADKIVGDSE